MGVLMDFFLEIHAAHAAHAAAAHAARHAAASRLLLRSLGDHGFGGDQQAGDRSRVLQSGAHDLDRVDDAHGDHVAIFAGLGVVAEGRALVLKDLAGNDRGFRTGVGGDLAGRSLQRAANDVDAGFLVGIDAGRP